MCWRAKKRNRHRAATPVDILWTLLFLLLLITILLPSLMRAREKAKQAVCHANLRAVGMGMFIYANDNRDWLPRHYFETRESDAVPPVHGVRWVGTMGTSEFLSITKPTSHKTSPTRSHPSRSLFMLVISGTTVPGSYVCPSSGDIEDDLRNHGPDAAGGQGSSVARPGVDRFDFAGYDRLSYGYQLPFGRGGTLAEAAQAQLALAADKSPYYAKGDPGVAGTRTVHDRFSGLQPPASVAELSLVSDSRVWDRYNSRNHAGEGQNVLFADGHVGFLQRSIVGNDNIYTIQSGHTRDATETGIVPDAETAIGPLTSTDSFLVP